MLSISFALVAAACAVQPRASARGEEAWQHFARLDPPPPMLPLGVGCAVAANDLGWIAVGAGQDRDVGVDSGSVALWRVQDDVVVSHGVVVHPRASTNSAFGSALDFDSQGAHLAIGAPNESSAASWPADFQSGRVYLYRALALPHGRSSAHSTARWRAHWMLEASIESHAPRAGAHFGAALALDGERIIIGSPAHSGRGVAVGRAEVFVRTSGGWKFEAELIAPNAAAGMRFGTSVALHTAQRGGDLALIGSPNFNGVGYSSGCADLFRRTNDGWQHIARLTAPTPQAGSWFAISLALDDELIAIGAPQETPQAPAGSQTPPEHAGVVHLYTCSAGGACNSWTHTGALASPQPWCDLDRDRSEAFGMSVAISPRRIVIGASEACAPISTPDGARVRFGAGAVYIVDRNADDAWRVEGRLVAPTALEEVHDGYRVAVGEASGGPFIVAGRLGNFDLPSPSEANVFALTTQTRLAASSAASSAASRQVDSASR